MMKNKLLEFGNLHEEMRKEAKRIIELIKPLVENVTEAQIIQSLRDQEEYYWKHDLLKIGCLAKKYQIKITRLNELFEKYVNLEKEILKRKTNLEKLGLKDLSFGPKSISASSKDNLGVCIYINLKKQDLEINVYPEFDEEDLTENYKKFVKELSYEINTFLQKD